MKEDTGAKKMIFKQWEDLPEHKTRQNIIAIIGTDIRYLSNSSVIYSYSYESAQN